MLINRLINSTMPIINGLCEEFATSSYTPEYFELKIGGQREICPEMLRITDDDGRATLIKGSIDRVDTYRYGDDVYVRVVDYKTGQKDFSPDDMEKGKNLQMFLYLKAVVDSRNENFHRDIGLGENGKLIPAGVIYVKSDLADTKISHASPLEEDEAVKNEQKRDGMLLSDPISLSAMNIEFLPIKINKNGSYSKESQKKMYDSEGWKSLSETVENAVKEVSKKMRSGNISANPLIESSKSPCNYCKYKPICRNAKIK
jgi:ATP-dependent helicase/nuclease subunit B